MTNAIIASHRTPNPITARNRRMRVRSQFMEVCEGLASLSAIRTGKHPRYVETLIAVGRTPIDYHAIQGPIDEANQHLELWHPFSFT